MFSQLIHGYAHQQEYNLAGAELKVFNSAHATNVGIVASFFHLRAVVAG